MKKIFILLAIAFVTNASYSNSVEFSGGIYKYNPPKKLRKNGIKNVTDDGFFINIGSSLYSKNFFVQQGFDNETKYRFGVGPNLEVGNMFRVFWSDKSALGVRMSWLNINYSTLKANNKIECKVIQASLLKFGPYFTGAINDEFGFDIFAQLSPTYLYNFNDSTGNNGYAGFPVSLGFDFRYEGVTIGTDFNIGSASLVDEHADLLFTKPQIGFVRIFVGYKF